jgi:hypothetical protein
VCSATNQRIDNSIKSTFKIAKFTGTLPSDMVEVNSFTFSRGSDTTTITYDSNIQVDGVNTTGAKLTFNINGIWYKLKEPLRFIIVC